MTKQEFVVDVQKVLGCWVAIRSSQIGGRTYAECYDVRDGRTYCAADSKIARKAYNRLMAKCQLVALALVQDAMNKTA